MNKSTRRPLAGLLVLLAIGLGAAGCANPKYVAASTGGPDDMRFLYVDQVGGQGIIKCARAEDGTLSNCRRQRLVLFGE